LADVNALIIRAETEREDICRLINQLYRDSLPTDTLALNKVHAYLRDKKVAWQIDFDRLLLPKPRTAQLPPAKRDSKRSSAFDSVRSMWPDFNPYLPSSSVSEAEDSKTRRVASSPSDFSEAESGVELEKRGFVLEKGIIDSENSGIDSEKGSIDLAKGGINLGNVSTEVDVVDGRTPREVEAKSDPDSDSTIGAAREEVALPTTLVPPESVSFMSYIAFAILLIPFLCRNKTQGYLLKIHLSVRHDCRDLLLKI
jgi:1-phosphatidylinositol-3-phosphate 5-kinase